jgi:hypothetical protein
LTFPLALDKNGVVPDSANAKAAVNPALHQTRNTKASRFTAGQTSPLGSTIDMIYGQTEKVLVFRSREGNLDHWIAGDELSEKDELALRRYTMLLYRVSDILPRDTWRTLLDELALALFNSLATNDPEKSANAFSEIESRVEQRTIGFSRFVYITAALASSFILGVVFFSLYWFYPTTAYRPYALYLVFALAGSLASVILRSQTIEIGPYERFWYVIVRGVFRILLGGLLASFFIAACKANLIVGIAANNPWSFLAFSFLSGFSERFVPDILAGLEERQKRKILANLDERHDRLKRRQKIPASLVRSKKNLPVDHQ